MNLTDNLTPRAQQILSLAAKVAKEMNHSYVGGGHMLLGMLKLGQGEAASFLQECGHDLNELAAKLRAKLGGVPQDDTSKPTPPPESSRVVEPAKRAPEVRWYVGIDVGTQWFCRLIRQEVEMVAQKDNVIKEEVTDIPNEIRTTAFLTNIFSRQSLPWMNVRGETYGCWSISEAEAIRVINIIKLLPQSQEFDRLVQYKV